MQDYYVKLAMAKPGIRFNISNEGFNYPDYMSNNIASWLTSYSSNIEYDIEKVTPIIEDSVYDTLMAGKGMCIEKSNCFQFMCYLAGIPCIVLREPGHAYTMEYIKEKNVVYYGYISG